GLGDQFINAVRAATRGAARAPMRYAVRFADVRRAPETVSVFRVVLLARRPDLRSFRDAQQARPPGHPGRATSSCLIFRTARPRQGSGPFPNPNGILSFSPALRGTSY